MRIINKLTAAGAALALVGIAGAAPVGATPPTGYGFDNIPHLIVGGGSDTTYRALVSLTDLWNGSPGCKVITAVGSTLGQCEANAAAETNTLGSYQHDTVAQANPVGSGAGIASLNGFGGAAYAGTNTNVNFARSSRAPKRTGGSCTGGDELTCDTFWGFAQDGIEVMVFNARNSVQSKASPAMTPAELANIWNCTYAKWSDVPSLGIVAASAEDGPIVPWGMNASSGTYATFKDYLINNGSAGAAFTPNAGVCDHKLTNGDYPFENDIKPILNDVLANGIPADGLPAGLSTDPNSKANPINWIWFGSFGELSAFKYKSSATVGGTAYTAYPAPVNGVLPSSSGIFNNTYPIGRTLYHVTLKGDADCPKTSGACDFNGNVGPVINATTNDLSVVGASSGTGGAVREFTRWLCRTGSARHAIDPYTGKNYVTEIGSAISGSGFTAVPNALKTPGSACLVQS
jgi:ABC-type phosphate transport system substrate-binding protein